MSSRTKHKHHTTMQAMIFAAGFGTRLKPLTDTLPKALVTAQGVPLLHRVIRKLQAEGFYDIVVNVHHFAGKIKSYLEENQNFGLNIRISDETEQLLDTGGAIRRAQKLFNGDEPVLIHNVDILSNARLSDFYAASMNCDALLLVSQRQTKRYLLFDENSRLVGWTNIETGEVRSPYADIQVDKCRRLAFAGIHCISPRLIKTMESWPDKFGIIDFYLSSCRDFNIRGYQQADLNLIDIGKIDLLERLNKGLIEIPT